jgi:cytochrome c biogenesis protein CcmG, thiol:disulfide interchange protein DsbE
MTCSPRVPALLRTLTVLSIALVALPCRPAALDAFDRAQYRGKVVLLDFWASWCGPCKESFPWMQRMAARYADRGLVVVAVNVDQDRALADRFLRDLRPSFAVLYDPQGNLAERYRVSGMPASFYIDRDSNVRYRHVGFHVEKADAAETELARLLAEEVFPGR